MVRPGLVVTHGGRPIADQQLGIRLFRDAATDSKREYRITYSRKYKGYIAYHRGRWIIDSNEMRQGAPNPGVLIDQIAVIRKWGK